MKKIKKNYLVIIPARGGSKGIPRKNIIDVAGKPLIAWTIKHALNVDGELKVVVSTDDEEIASISQKFGATVPFIRPSNLAGDNSTTESVLLHAIYWFEQNGFSFDAVILLQPTSPIRNDKSLEKAILQFESEGCDSLLSVTVDKGFYWKHENEVVALYDFKNRPRRQDIKKNTETYKENGSIYISKTELLKAHKNRLGGVISLFKMEQIESIDIDTEVDVVIADALLKITNQKSH